MITGRVQGASKRRGRAGNPSCPSPSPSPARGHTTSRMRISLPLGGHRWVPGFSVGAVAMQGSWACHIPGFVSNPVPVRGTCTLVLGPSGPTPHGLCVALERARMPMALALCPPLGLNQSFQKLPPARSLAFSRPCQSAASDGES